MIELVENRSIPSTPISSRSIAWQRAFLRKRTGFLRRSRPGKLRLDLPVGYRQVLPVVKNRATLVVLDRQRGDRRILHVRSGHRGPSIAPGHSPHAEPRPGRSPAVNSSHVQIRSWRMCRSPDIAPWPNNATTRLTTPRRENFFEQ